MLPEHSDASMSTTSLVGPDRCYTTGRERPGTLIPLFGMNDKHHHLLTHAFRVHFTLNQYITKHQVNKTILEYFKIG